MISIKQKILTIVLCLTVVLPWYAQANHVSARLDRNVVSLEESFQLMIEVSGKDDHEEPDIQALQQDFDIVTTSQNSRISIVNGKSQSRRQWIITLMPKRTGKLSIPAIKIGQEKTNLLLVQVVERNPGTEADSREKYYVEVEVDKKNPYVQAQVILTVRLFFTVNIADGRLSEPTPEGAIVEALGDETSYNTKRESKTYRVIERRYAIFPQKSGRMTIPPLLFEGQIADAGGGNSLFGDFLSGRDPFGPDPFSRLQRSVPIRLRSKEIDLDVRAKPEAYQGTEWLPATSFAISEQWSPDPPKFRVGDPVTRTIVIQAQGVSAVQLPDLPQTQEDAFKIYPDKSEEESFSDGSGMASKKQFKLAIVPNQAGQYTLPEIKFKWWDTVKDKERIAILPSKKIQVLPYSGALVNQGTKPSSHPMTNSTSSPPDKLVPDQPRVITATPKLWIALSFALFIAWLGTLILWLKERRHKPMRKITTEDIKAIPLRENTNKIKQQLTAACKTNDAKAARDALLALAAYWWPDNPPRTLPAIAMRFPNKMAKNIILEIDKTLYTQSNQWNGGIFVSQIDLLFSQQPHENKIEEEFLPPLYPRTVS